MSNAIRDFYLENIKHSLLPRLECEDGFSITVQAGHFHASLPKQEGVNGDYTHWQVGFPSEVEPLLLPYGVVLISPCSSIYEYIPTEIVNAIIAKHGGLKKEGECR